MTEMGVILGRAGYMSPEQAREILVEAPAHLRRRTDPATGLALILPD